MIGHLAVTLEMFDTHRIDNEIKYLEMAEVDLNTMFCIAKDVLIKFNGTQLSVIPTQHFREAIATSKTIVPRIEFHYWNSLSSEVVLTCAQYVEKLMESIIHHTRLLYVDLWGMVYRFGIPIASIINLTQLPYGVFLNVRAA